MKQQRFEELLDPIIQQDSRYPVEAYVFLRESLDYTMRLLRKPEQGPGRHISGQELLEGLRLFALQEYGPVAHTVLRTWNITRTEDFGEIVFNLVNGGLLGKTDRDRKEDFANGYDFHSAFVAPYRSARVTAAKPEGATGTAVPTNRHAVTP